MSSALAFVACFIIGLVLIYDGISKYRLLQKIKNTGTSKVHSVALGLTEVFGTATYLDDLILYSPISKTACVYWSVSYQYYGLRGKWTELFRDASSSNFFLKDETGKILIELKDAQIEVSSDNRYYGRLQGENPKGVFHTKLEDIAITHINSLPKDKKEKILSSQGTELRIIECFIKEGDPLYTLGTSEVKDKRSSIVGCENLIIRKGKYEKVMFIGDRDERKIQASLIFSIYVEIFIGLGATLVGSFFVVAMLIGLLRKAGAI